MIVASQQVALGVCRRGADKWAAQDSAGQDTFSTNVQLAQDSLYVSITQVTLKVCSMVG
jgi:hypothetical protein